jgi:tetratricopeptide (TPR) repeat protein
MLPTTVSVTSHHTIGLIFLYWLGGKLLHEMAHTVAIDWAVRPTIRNSFRLNLNPFCHSDWIQSWLLPSLLLLTTMQALPGIGVEVHPNYLRNRMWQTFVAAAGPIATLTLIVIVIGQQNTWHDGSLQGTAINYWLSIEIIAFVCSLLPVPGLDGYGILEPWLPRRWQSYLQPWKQYSTVAFVVLVLPLVRRMLQNIGFSQYNIEPDHMLTLVVLLGTMLLWKWLNSFRLTNLARREATEMIIEEVDESLEITSTNGLERDLAVISHAIAQNPAKASPYLWRQRSDVLKQLGQYDAAIANYDEALTHHPKALRLWRERGVLFAEQQQFERALESYARATADGAGTVDDWHYQGDALLELGRYEVAIAAYDKVLARRPTIEAHILADRGYALYQLGRYPAARQSLDQSLKLERNSYYAWYWYAVTLQALNDHTAALMAAKTGLSYAPKDYALANLVITLLRQLRQYDVALAAYDDFMVWHLDRVALAYAKALLLLQLNRPTAALDMLRPIAAKQFLPSQLRLRCRLHYQAQDYAAAMADCQIALALAPDNAISLELQGQILEGLGQTEAAIGVYQTLLEKHPELYWVRVHLGLLWGNLQCHEEAYCAYEIVLNDRPDDVDVLYLQALTLIELDRSDEAKIILSRLFAIVPDHKLAQRVYATLVISS